MTKYKIRKLHILSSNCDSSLRIDLTDDEYDLLKIIEAKTAGELSNWIEVQNIQGESYHE